MLASDRSELTFDRQSCDRLSRWIGQWGLASQAVLRQSERACLGVELLYDQDARAIEVDVRAAQRVQLARTKAPECGDLEPCGKRWAGQLARAANQLLDLLLAWRLFVTTARTLRDSEPGERVMADQASRLRRSGIVEHRSQRQDGAVVLATRRRPHRPLGRCAWLRSARQRHWSARGYGCS